MIHALAEAARNSRTAMVKELFNKETDANSVSRISAGTSVKGEISSHSDIRIDGLVEGRLYSEGRVVVGENAEIKGTILCSDLDLWGKVEGEIFVRDVLSLKATSSVHGDLHVKKIQVEMGAEINGTCKMISEADFDALLGTESAELSEV